MPLQSAELFGPFALGPKIGGGGMASVYLGKYVAAPGEEPPPGQEIVALKVMKGEFVKNAEYEKMFLDEAQILTQLSHPNVIRTVGYGAQAGAWFIAMELLMGRSLFDVYDTARVAGRRIPFDLAAWMAREVARGLHHAHELVDEEDGHRLGIVHRDVNPSNVFIGYDGVVKLLDFGLAKARKRQTQSVQGLIKGKIPYLSPEQIHESGLDGRSDLYALGTTLWEITTMRRLFKRDTDIATVRAIQKGEVPDPRTFIDDFPAPLWKVIERALRQDREQRYPSAEAMADDLDAFVGSASDAQMRARLAQFLEELFPGEAHKQAGWLSEATGRDRQTFVPIVPLAEVPAAEQSTPVLPAEMEAPPPSPPPPPSPSPSPPPPPRPKDNRDVMIFAALGAMAGLVAVVVWAAFMR
ncbi:MAG TPA: serine/threonine-protein kinase [Polyangiaceae bacterium]|nr:serine/threonine-protein kinase [Polyangiaceae bacterium]